MSVRARRRESRLWAHKAWLDPVLDLPVPWPVWQWAGEEARAGNWGFNARRSSGRKQLFSNQGGVFHCWEAEPSILVNVTTNKDLRQGRSPGVRTLRPEPGGWGSLQAAGRGEECARCSQLHRRLRQGCSQGRTVVWLPCGRPLYQLLIAMVILHNSPQNLNGIQPQVCFSSIQRFGGAGQTWTGLSRGGVGDT